jgi:hypothetical protein
MIKIMNNIMFIVVLILPFFINIPFIKNKIAIRIMKFNTFL